VPSAIAPGLCAAFLVAVVATLGGRFAPLVGAPVIAIALGVVIRAFVPLPNALRTGLGFASKQLLQGAIVLSGFGLSFLTVVHTGLATLPVTLGTVAIALALAPFLGRLLGLGTSLRRLVGVGTAICGASAIAAVASVIEPEEEQFALAIATVFCYNVIAVLLFPSLGHLMHLTQNAFGLWAGTAINDTSSVVAAGYVYGHEAGAYATIVKLTRATLILPIVAVLAFARVRAQRATGASIPWRRIIPWFIVWFLGAALVNTSGIVPDRWHPALGLVVTFLVTAALGAIGLQTEFRKLLRAGARPLALGFCLWVAVAVSSLAIARVTGL
jgi:uncharacterized integral membrane protein (TIGR00698 family)